MLGDLVKVALEHLFNVLARVDFSSSNHSTQVIVDLTAFEEAFQGFVTSDMRYSFNFCREENVLRGRRLWGIRMLGEGIRKLFSVYRAVFY